VLLLLLFFVFLRVHLLRVLNKERVSVLPVFSMDTLIQSSFIWVTRLLSIQRFGGRPGSPISFGLWFVHFYSTSVVPSLLRRQVLLLGVIKCVHTARICTILATKKDFGEGSKARTL